MGKKVKKTEEVKVVEKVEKPAPAKIAKTAAAKAPKKAAAKAVAVEAPKKTAGGKAAAGKAKAVKTEAPKESAKDKAAAAAKAVASEPSKRAAKIAAAKAKAAAAKAAAAASPKAVAAPAPKEAAKVVAAPAPKEAAKVVASEAPKEAAKAAPAPTPKAPKEKNQKESEMSPDQLKDRKRRTVFVGNVAMSTSAKQLQKLFRACGKIEKVWFRSICVTEESKMSKRAKIITKDYGEFKDNKNAYILYKEEKSSQEAKIKFNQVIFGDRHLRVDTCGLGLEEQEGEHPKISKSGRNTCINPWEDFTSTLFIGNLPFVVSEEELRAAFIACGQIENVRLVRDPKTHLGKGIGYIMFKNKDAMNKALLEKKDLWFKGRTLRVARAVEPKRREKKQLRKEAALQERRDSRKQRRAIENEDIDKLKNIADAMSSEDSDDEKIIKKKKERDIRLEKTSFDNFGQRSDSKAERDGEFELNLSNMHAIARRKRQTLLANMINKGTSLKKERINLQTPEEKDLYKQDTFKKGLKERLARHKADNLKKINKIRIKGTKV